MNGPARDIVSGEEHARVKAQLARVEAVLADLLNERRGTNALQEEMLAWLRNPEAVHGFMNIEPFFSIVAYDGEQSCRFCGHEDGSHYFDSTQDDECPLLRLWRVLGDERYQKTMDSMFEHWCNREMNRQAYALRQAGRMTAASVAAVQRTAAVRRYRALHELDGTETPLFRSEPLEVDT